MSGHSQKRPPAEGAEDRTPAKKGKAPPEKKTAIGNGVSWDEWFMLDGSTPSLVPAASDGAIAPFLFPLPTQAFSSPDVIEVDDSADEDNPIYSAKTHGLRVTTTVDKDAPDDILFKPSAVGRKPLVKQQVSRADSCPSTVPNDSISDGSKLPSSKKQHLHARVEAEMTVVKGAAAHISAEEVVDCIAAAIAAESYWRRNQGENGYLNGEILNAHKSQEDFAGAQAVKHSSMFKKAEAAARAIVGPGILRDRIFINVRPPADPDTGALQGSHPLHKDTRNSTVIVSVRCNYEGRGNAGDIVYDDGQNRVCKQLDHGDVGVYTRALHHVSMAGSIKHGVSANSSPTVTKCTIMFESQTPLPPNFIYNLNARAKDLAKPPAPALPLHRPLRSCLIPERQIEKGSFQRFTQAERSKGGEASQDAAKKAGKEQGHSHPHMTQNRFAGGADDDVGTKKEIDKTLASSRSDGGTTARENQREKTATLPSFSNMLEQVSSANGSWEREGAADQGLHKGSAVRQYLLVKCPGGCTWQHRAKDGPSSICVKNCIKTGRISTDVDCERHQRKGRVPRLATCKHAPIPGTQKMFSGLVFEKSPNPFPGVPFADGTYPDETYP